MFNPFLHPSTYILTLSEMIITLFVFFLIVWVNSSLYLSSLLLDLLQLEYYYTNFVCLFSAISS